MTATTVRKLSFGFFILLSSLQFISMLRFGILHGLKSGYYPALIISVLFVVAYPLQLRLKRKHADLVLGTVSLLVSLYMILAYLDDLFDWVRGEDIYSNPPIYFGGWGLFILVMNVMAILMIYSNKAATSNKTHRPA